LPYGFPLPSRPGTTGGRLRLPSRRRRRRARLALFGEQADLVHARRADVIDHVDDHAIARAGVALDVDALIRLVGQLIAHLLRELIGSDLIGAEEDLAVAHHRDEDGV